MSEYITTTITEKKIATATAFEPVMSDHPPPPQYREFPRSSIELAGQSVSDVTHGIRAGGPVMMGVIVLNLVGIAAAIFFLWILIQGQQAHLSNLLTLQVGSMEKILAVHNHEFDALMEMQSRSNAALTATQSANIPPQVTTPPPILQPPARR